MLNKRNDAFVTQNRGKRLVVADRLVASVATSSTEECGSVTPLNATFWLVLVQAVLEQQDPKDQMARQGQKVSSTKISCYMIILLDRTTALYN